MSIYKRMNKDGTASYVVRYRQNGRHRSCSFATKKDASAYEAQVKLARRGGTLRELDAGKTLLHVFGEQWWNTHVKPNLARATQEKYANSWNTRVLPQFGETPMREITPRAIMEWQAEMQKSGMKAPAIKQAINTLQACLQLAVVWGEIQTNPCREVRKPSAKRTRAVRPVTPIEVERIRAHMIEKGQHRDATFVSVLAYSGMRPGEALALSWEHIRQNTILVERATAYGEIKSTKTSKIRSVKLLPALRHDLNEWQLRSEHAGGLIFPGSEANKPWSREAYKSWERRAFKTAAVAIGRDDATPYSLRHSFASLLIREGKSIVEVAAQLGHAPTMTLDTYAHVFADLDEEGRLPASEMIDQAREMILRVQAGDDSASKQPKNVLTVYSRETGAKGHLAAIPLQD